MTKWQASLVQVWTPTAHASGFVIDASGLIATNQRAIGTATSVEVQITRLDKVAAKVIVADRERDVAILRIDAQTAAALPAVPLDCSATSQPPIVEGQEIVALQAPLAQERGAITGDVSRVRANVIESDLSRRLAVPAGRSSSQAGAWWESPQPPTRALIAARGDVARRAHRRSMRRRRACAKEHQCGRAAGRHASPRGPGSSAAGRCAEGARRTPCRRFASLSIVFIGIRHRADDTVTGVCGTRPARADVRAGAQGLRQLVGVRRDACPRCC